MSAVLEDLPRGGVETPPMDERDVLAAELTARLEGAASSGLPVAPHSRLGRLAALFGLSEFETDVVAVLWTTAFDPDLRTALLDRDGPHLTPRGIAQCCSHPARVRLSSESPLRVWRLVDEHPLIDGSAALAIDPHIVAWLEGEPELDRALTGRARRLAPTFELPSWPLERWAAQLKEGLERGLRWRVRLETEDPILAAACATAVARRVQLPVLRVDLAGPAGEEAADRALRAHRQAYLDTCALYFDAGAASHWIPIPFALQFVAGTAAPAPAEGVRDIVLRLAAPTVDERCMLWRAALPGAAAWPQQQLDALALHAEAGVDDIARVAAAEPVDVDAALHALRGAAQNDFDGLAQRIDAQFGWDDLVVPEPVHERLSEIAFEARERGRLWADAGAARLYPQGRGLVALFAGPPGTGKTMAAQVIASELGLDLWRVDVSAVLSKWVGETAQHLQKILSARTARRAVLFFDEADALYGKRVEEIRDAQDRYANMDVSHLMVALEAYDGIILMATNLRANIDGAFMRRIRHCVEFPRPDQNARRAIWGRVVAALFGIDVLGANDLDRLSRLEATGAQIKNAALSAVFAARRAGSPPDTRLLGRMLARELAKDGSGLSQRDLDAMLEDGK